MKLSQFRINIL